MADVFLRLSKRPLFVGSYLKVPVRIDPKSGLLMEDLDFIVREGPPGGRVSVSQERQTQEKAPSIMLLVGYRPGDYALQALKKGTTTVVGEARFRVDALWPSEEVGPPRWFDGQGTGFASGAAWGGGPAGPQNINVVPATGTRRIAILLVDTSSQRFTTDAATLQAHRDRWLNEVVNGVTDGGVTRSTRQFYQEVSYGAFTLSAEVFGPVELPGSYDDYFNADNSPKGTYYQACFTAGDGLINYNNFDTLLCVSQPVTGATPRAAWPYASIGNWGPYTTAEGNKNYGVISMPNEWGVTDTREIHETLAHELGHNLGLGDQYAPSVPGRNPGAWEMMDADDPLPHFSLSHRMMLGWVPAAAVQSFNFVSMGVPVDQTITLHPAEAQTLPAGRKRGIEVRLADGWNYYFEYRAGQVTQIADRNLPTDSRVLGTDVVSGPFSPPIARPAILLLNNDGDGDGSVLGNGQDYEETDTTDPVFPTDFRVDVSGEDGTKAEVRIRYGVNSRPDPSIRPWPASPDRQWQSPDIEVRNVRNQANPAWFNVPWEGNTNTVIARVKNNGSLDAPGVRVNFFVKNYNIGGTPETFLGTDVRDVAAGATVEFSTTWTPPNQGHFCVIARIPLYQNPTNPSVVEMTELNNLAQSNYDRFISRTASPATREVSFMEVGNPYPLRTRIFIVAGQNNPAYRTYLETAWLTLNPGETRRVKVMYEFAFDPRQPSKEQQERRIFREFGGKPNNVGLTAFIEDPRDTPRHAIQVLGGAQAQVATGRATRFEDFEVRDGVVRGTIVTVDDGKPVRGGKVILSVTTGRGKKQEKKYQTLEVAKGRFQAQIPQVAGGTVEAYYVPPEGLADCSREPVRL
ncbi:CARDB domain-containing protein [Hyalangium rubrum]|uniref:CARDB domain-containing protein n=1 Tax=Hyalangium rubrum TaxID=3103134 RepID=A0ABU5GVS8_9BACT|nr:CARDB domain-containing protein [Hyalangium sp. s54d21]MDY7224819.1 CARDB domain-containing protein [Hyalangium sp. s54d21]